MVIKLLPHQRQAVKKSFFNILAFLLESESIDSRYIRCLLKWGLQLDLNREDLVISNMNPSQLSFTEPREKVESVYHLVYLIYLDNIVEDVELEVATLYSERLGFQPEIISQLFEYIAESAEADGSLHNIQEQIGDFMKRHTS